MSNSELDLVFAGITESEEQRKADTPSLADYNRLFGQDFVRCRKNIRPYLPQALAAQLVPLTEFPDVEDEDGQVDDFPTAISSPKVNSLDSTYIHDDAVPIPDEVSEEPGIGENAETSVHIPEIQESTESDEVMDKITRSKVDSAHMDTCRLREQLNSGILKRTSQRELKLWLVGQLDDDDDDNNNNNNNNMELLAAWCSFWVDKVQKVDNYQDQMLVRSLFLHSLRWLSSLWSCRAWADGFMLVNMADADTESEPEDDDRDAFRENPHLAAIIEERKRLTSLAIEDTVVEDVPTLKELAERIASQQDSFFCNFLMRSSFHGQWPIIAAFETLYMRVNILSHQAPHIDRNGLKHLRAQRLHLLKEPEMADTSTVSTRIAPRPYRLATWRFSSKSLFRTRMYKPRRPI